MCSDLEGGTLTEALLRAKTGRGRSRPDVRWHLDEVFVSINGRQLYVGRASSAHMFAPSFAAGGAVVQSPQPRSRTLRPFLIPSVPTNASPLSPALKLP